MSLSLMRCYGYAMLDGRVAASGISDATQMLSGSMERV